MECSEIESRNGIAWCTAPADFEPDGDAVLIVKRTGGMCMCSRMRWDDLEKSIENACAVLAARHARSAGSG